VGSMTTPMSMPMPPPFTWSQFGTFAWSWTASIVLLAISVAYLAGVARYAKLNAPTRWSPKRTISFLGGIVVVFLAMESVVGVYDMTLFTDHMVQHLMLIMVAAGLFAMGAPFELLCETTPGVVGRVINRVAASKVGEVIGSPIFGFLAYALFIPITHLTSLFNLMLSHMWVHHVEQVGFLLVGYLFWRPVVAIEPTRHPLTPGLRIVYLALAVPVDTITGLALVMTNHEMFSAYVAMPRLWGPSYVMDLRTGGAVMWIGGDLLMLLAMIPVAVLWLRSEDRSTTELDAQLDAERAAAGLPFTRREAEATRD
jgi:cytochrome c oxidase assembly factor CtaG